MDKIFILTGAGISAESGIDTFRDPKGVWARFDPMELATPEGFAKNPTRVMEFYNERRRNGRAAEPNAAHLALAQLQRLWPAEVTLVTQNVDDLHERAGAEVIHMHGALESALCSDCGHRWPAPMVMAVQDPCPQCSAAATRPDIVWFGEIPYHMDQIADRLADCDLIVVIGSSGTVWPAAGFVELAREAGARSLVMNLDRQARYNGFDDTRIGPASRLVPEWVAQILGAIGIESS